MPDKDRLMALGQAVDDEAINTWTLNQTLSAKQQLMAIIDWHIQVATDPAVNGGYELVKRASPTETEDKLS